MIERKPIQNKLLNRRTLIVWITRIEQMIKQSDIEQNRQLIIIEIPIFYRDKSVEQTTQRKLQISKPQKGTKLMTTIYTLHSNIKSLFTYTQYDTIFINDKSLYCM